MSYRFLTRMSTALLAFLLLSATLLTACGSVETETTADTTASTDTTPTETAETRPAHGLPEKDFGGAPFRISVFGDDNPLSGAGGEHWGSCERCHLRSQRHAHG